MYSIRSAELTKSEAKTVLANVLNFPLFVPELGPQVTRSLVSGDLKLFLAELERLSSLGSASASGLLGYLHLKGAISGVANLERATAMCRKFATSGDPYCQYVMGWVCKSR